MESSRWQWDPPRQQYYYVDGRTREYVFQDGSRLPLRIATSSRVTTGGTHRLNEGRSDIVLSHSGVQNSNPYAPLQPDPQAPTQVLESFSAAVPSNRGNDPRQMNSPPQRYGGTTENSVRATTASGTSVPISNLGHMDSLGEPEQLYTNYKVRKHGFFCFGRVFLVLWVEPAGGTVNSSSTSLVLGQGQHNEKVFSKVRRFVVIREGNGYCSAVPIATYGQQGVAKRGVVKSEHAIIYTGREPPKLARHEMPGPGEQPIRSVAIRVVPDDKAEALDPYSRIDFGKVHTIQHNIKVRPFGKVHPDSMGALYSQFQQVWANVPSDQPEARASQGSKKPQVEDGTRGPRSASRTQTSSSRNASGNDLLAGQDAEDEDDTLSDSNGIEHRDDEEEEDAYYTDAHEGGLTPPYDFR